MCKPRPEQIYATRQAAGAAGGVGFAALALLDANLCPGTELVFDLVGLHAYLADATLVITGEGSLDEQTLHGKAPIGVALAARATGIPVVAVCGRMTLGQNQLREAGIMATYSSSPTSSRTCDAASPTQGRCSSGSASRSLPSI